MKTKLFKVSIIVIIGILLLSVSCKGKCSKTKGPESITINIEETTLYIGDVIDLEASMSPVDAEGSITWSISSDIVQIKDNKLTALDEGIVTLTATSTYDEKVSDSKELTIIRPDAVGLDLNIEEELTIYIGEQIEFNASVTPANALQNVLYSSSDESVGSFNNNVFTALKAGVTYVKAEIESNPLLNKSVTINVLHPLLNLEEYNAKAIIGAPGEDASTMYHIHYNVTNTSSYALVTKATDPNFENAKAYYGEGYYYEKLDGSSVVNWEPRNVWNIDVTGLEENTEYIYKINNGNDTYSDIYRFRTAGGDSHTSFLFLADIHYGPTTDGTSQSSSVCENTIEAAMKINPNISFVMNAGDTIDTGGNEDIWDLFFKYSRNMKNLPYIGVPGNHEHYEKEINMGTHEYYSVHSSSPLNGPKELLGASCWFKHNDTLFILVDNVRSTGYNEQLAWMQYLLENVEYKYSMVCFHCPVNYNSPGNADYDPNFLRLFDKFSVDLVLSGHYHGEGYFENYYNEQETDNPYLGTTYLTGAFAGLKSTTAENAINAARGYIIDITDERISITSLYANGNIITERVITGRTHTPAETKPKEELLNSIKFEELTDTNQVKFSWSPDFYGNVKKVTITETLREELVDYSVFPSSAYTSLVFDSVIAGYDYNFEMEIIFNDGEKEIKTYKLNKHTPINLQATPVTSDSIYICFDELPMEIRYSVYNFKVYVNGTYHSEFLHNNGRNTNYTITNLDPNTDYEITIIACKRNGSQYFIETTNAKTYE